MINQASYVRAAMPYTMLPNAFIDNYLPSPHPLYPLVYIVFYRHCTAGGGDISVNEVALRLSVLESDVVNALKYWHEQGIIYLSQAEGALNIEFLPVYDKTAASIFDSEEKERPDDSTQASGEASAVKEAEMEDRQCNTAPEESDPKLPEEARPEYAPEELELYRGANEDIRRMFDKAEKSLGKMLTHSDMSIIFGLYDWLRMSVPLIDELISHCAQNGHRNMRYIEKCAISWVEYGVKTVEDARDYIHLYSVEYREILKAFGHTGRGPSASEKGYMDKWRKEYNMPVDVIAEACDRTIIQIGRPLFSYADKILTNWHNEGVTALADIKSCEERFAAEKDKTNKPPQKTVRSQQKAAWASRFANFKQRDWDYDAIEQLEKQYLLNGSAKD